MEGVMAGEDMLTFVDLSRSALERSPRLLRWVRSWTSRPHLQPLTPVGAALENSLRKKCFQNYFFHSAML
jgi:hypothetical protein